MKKVGIFGGSFNPIHTGHIALAKSLCEKAGLDEVWFMVSPMNPFKRELHFQCQCTGSDSVGNIMSSRNT